jgi:hypothetical protein
MACPTVQVVGKTVILLSGYERAPLTAQTKEPRPLRVEAIQKLRQSAAQYPDAVAFGYTAGRWIPGA